MKYRGNYKLLALIACGFSFQVGAAAFSIKEQSVTYLGTAFSNTASGAEDASTGYYNPAGLVELKHSQIVLSETYINARNKLYTASATNNAGTAVTGNIPTVPKSHGLVPGLHMAWKVNKCLALGLNVVAPFGLSTRYTNTDIARFMATESKLEAIDITPSISYKINNNWSVGAGFDAMLVKVRLMSLTNFGGANGYSDNRGRDWAYGYHLGVMFKPSEQTKMGLAYFSKFKPTLTGNAETANLPVTAPSTLEGSVTLPYRIVYSVTQKYNDQWTGMGEVEWDHWSKLHVLRINYNTGRNSTEELYYRNSWRVALGAMYHFSHCLTFKGGISFEQTPVNDQYRTARVPDSDRYWLAFGVKYALNRNICFDAAYAHLFAKSANISQRAVGDSRTLFGRYKNSGDVVGLQLAWNFV